MSITYAVCTYNRADRLPNVLASMARQKCAANYEILIIDNNSSDNTKEVARKFRSKSKVEVRYVCEKAQGIAHARNRAVEESLGSSFLVFVDDDELPCSNLLDAALMAFNYHEADCVGGRIRVPLPATCPDWIDNELLGFLGNLDYGEEPFWIKDESTPIWTGNIGFRVSVFANDPGLRFDTRYNRIGSDVGGGEDAVMFRELLGKGFKIRYEPAMFVDHLVDNYKLTRKYFLSLHEKNGYKTAKFNHTPDGQKLWGVPRFLIRKLFTQALKTTLKIREPHGVLIREAMKVAYTAGMIRGYFSKDGA